MVISTAAAAEKTALEVAEGSFRGTGFRGREEREKRDVEEERGKEGPKRKRAARKRRREKERPMVKKWAKMKSLRRVRRRDLRGILDLEVAEAAEEVVVVGRKERAHDPPPPLPLPLLRLPM